MPCSPPGQCCLFRMHGWFHGSLAFLFLKHPLCCLPVSQITNSTCAPLFSSAAFVLLGSLEALCMCGVPGLAAAALPYRKQELVRSVARCGAVRFDLLQVRML